MGERVKLVIQTQDANPKIRSGEVARYTGIGNCFTRIHSEQGVGAFWRGNGTNIIRYFPTQAFNLAFNDTIMSFNPYAKEFSVVAIVSKFIVAQIAVTASGLVAYPFDT